jgi:hypothetical protein
MLGHEIYDIRGHLLGRYYQVPFILPIFIINQNDALPSLNILQSLRNGVKLRIG